MWLLSIILNWDWLDELCFSFLSKNEPLSTLSIRNCRLFWLWRSVSLFVRLPWAPLSSLLEEIARILFLSCIVFRSSFFIFCCSILYSCVLTEVCWFYWLSRVKSFDQVLLVFESWFPAAEVSLALFCALLVFAAWRYSFELLKGKLDFEQAKEVVNSRYEDVVFSANYRFEVFGANFILCIDACLRRTLWETCDFGNRYNPPSSEEVLCKRLAADEVIPFLSLTIKESVGKYYCLVAQNLLLLSSSLLLLSLMSSLSWKVVLMSFWEI